MPVSKKASLFISSTLSLAVALSSGLALAQGAGEHGAGASAGAERGGAAAGGEHATPSAPARSGAGERGTGSPSANERPGTGGQSGKPAAAQSERHGAGARDEKAAPAAGERNGAAERNPRTEGSPRGEKQGETEHRGSDAAREGGHGGHVGITGEKRTRFQSVIRERHTEVLHGVDFRVGVGTVIPERYHFYPLPPTLIELVPEYRGYDYIVVEHQIIILEPGTRRIVDVIEE